MPHDGYLLTGYDPITGARCFLACENDYDIRARRRMDFENALGRTCSPVAELIHGSCPALVLGAGARDEHPQPRRLHRLMAADSYGSELCIALTQRGASWGALVLLRERASRPFSPTEAARAAELAQPLAQAVKRYVTSRPLRPRIGPFPPIVSVIDGDDQIAGTTSSGHDALRAVMPGVYPTRPPTTRRYSASSGTSPTPRGARPHRRTSAHPPPWAGSPSERSPSKGRCPARWW
ncbi:hypothetical protein ACFVYR_36600 [Streptomyces sp. NPDC058284]|uniref:hypothetical protein n=1 Tax=unclassified Streptomyces TaxID=2593676 RepID=UPI0036460CAE